MTRLAKFAYITLAVCLYVQTAMQPTSGGRIVTVQNLIDKLNELPEDLRHIPVYLETETEGGDLSDVKASIAESKIWWQADRIILSARY